jgi:adenylate cyclase
VHVVEVTALGQQRAGIEPAAEPELRTFLFADTHGYTAFTAQQGDTAGVDFQTVYYQITAERIQARAGRVIDLFGDAACGVFVSPRQAIQAAIELQDQFERAIQTERQLPLTLGIGVEAGEAIPSGGRYVGSAVNLAARICSLAGPGEVLIGETVSRLVRKLDGLLFVDRGQSSVRGYADPVHITQVVRENALREK